MEKERVTLTLPLPSRTLSPNGRPRHWAVRSRAVRSYRELAHLLALRHRPAVPWTVAKVTCRFFYATRRRRDRDNLLASMKPAFDGLADARLIADDAGLIHQPAEIVIDPDDPRVEITVERMGPKGT